MKCGTETKLEPVTKSCCAPSVPGRTSLSSAVEAADTSRVELNAAMVDLPGGSFLMGTDYAEAFAADGEGPVREVVLSPFRIDKFPVTNESFARFVEATGYKTEAELFGWSFVFWAHIPKHRLPQVQQRLVEAPWWCRVDGAYWKQPEGPDSDVKLRANHPVVHVSYNDALQFCSWAGRRLPTEAEWEYASRGGLVQKLYPWGDKLRPNGEHRCNIWQGEFPTEDTGEDGFSGTCPVDAFPPNNFGIYSTTGNTWEWCADWFSTSFHVTAERTNPTGPPEGTARVMKGGSYLCHKSYCNRYRVAARTFNTPDSSTSHLGFRCAQTI